MNKNIVGFICMLLVLTMVITGCSSPFKKKKEEVKKEEERIPVEVEKVALGEIYDEISFVGRVFSEKDDTIVSSVPGRVKSIEVNVGDKVESGDILFVIENEEVEKNLKMTEDALDEAERQRQNLDEKINSSTEPPLDSSVDMNAHMGNEMEKTLAGQKELQVKINELEAAKKQAEGAYEELKVKSPGSGTVSFISIKKGGIVTNTEPAMIVSDLEKMYIEINVTDRHINRIEKGNETILEIPAVSAKDLKGNIEFVSISPDYKNGLYPVRISIEENDFSLKPGMMGKAKLKINQKKDVIVVKSDAVLDKNGRKIVYIERDGKAVERGVKTGLDTGEKTEIAEGLKEGEKIIVKGQNFLREDSKVKVIGGGK